jgi:hypothetical protein
MIDKLILPGEVTALLEQAPRVEYANDISALEELSCNGKDGQSWNVSYTLPDGRTIHEASVVRVKNGISANYTDPYMRRRDPDCMFIADGGRTDKPLFSERFGYDFAGLRLETFQWLAQQHLAVFAFDMGRPGAGATALAICPANAGFFAFGLGLLQGVLDLAALDTPYCPSTMLFIAPPFRHTHFQGKQVVVHHRVDTHEIFSYNLYPGPSAKKGVYGALINVGANQGWVTAHCSAVQVVTPYDNIVTFMHEGASGGGKSEMLQQPHRLPDGRLPIGRNIISGEERHIEIQRTCELHPVCDDMGLCHPDFQEDNGKLFLMDAEDGWFIRVNHITCYGTDHDIEKLSIHPGRSLLFLNINAAPGATALIWEHIEDAPGKPCPNPRVIIPRGIVPNAFPDKVAVDIRSFGVRTPPCTSERPSYGILGLFHVLPAALAWLWRLVAPRGYSNPSIVGGDALESEGVGSYWPFATGRRVDQANLLLRQFQQTPRTRYILIPNQHVGAWETGFTPQWLTRDYLARRGHARFLSDQLTPARSSLLGYALKSMRIEGALIPVWLLQTETQPEVGAIAYDEGARQLRQFFHEQITTFLEPDLDAIGRQIIECCLSDGSVYDYEQLLGLSDG